MVVEIGKGRGFGAEATRALFDALAAGNGAMAQFSHPEFGGSGQWMRGGMLMIGDMFNRELATRVGTLCEDLSVWFAEHPEAARSSRIAPGSEWWPAGLHSASTSGAQNGVRYAYFPAQRRLAIERGGSVELYDTADHLIGGVSQQQGGANSLVFTSQRGSVELSTLRKVRQDSTSAPVPSHLQSSTRPEQSSPTETLSAATQHHDVLNTIERLATLHERGVLTDAEYSAKKTELLGKL